MDWVTAAASFTASLVSSGIAIGLVLGRLRSVEVDAERAAKRLEAVEGAAARLERATALLEKSIEHLTRGQDTYRADIAGLEARLLARLDSHHQALRRELEAAGVLKH